MGFHAQNALYSWAFCLPPLAICRDGKNSRIWELFYLSTGTVIDSNYSHRGLSKLKWPDKPGRTY